MTWTFNPIYGGRTQPIAWTTDWDSFKSQMFNLKRDAVAFAKDNPNGPPEPGPTMTLVDGKMVWTP